MFDVFLFFVFDTSHRAVFPLRPWGWVRALCLTLEHFLSVSATRHLLCNAGCLLLALPPQVATRGDNARNRLAQSPAQGERSRNVNHCACRRGEETGRDLRRGWGLGRWGGTRREEVGGESTSGDLRPLWRWGCPVSPHHTPRGSQAGAGGTVPTPPLPAARL